MHKPNIRKLNNKHYIMLKKLFIAAASCAMLFTVTSCKSDPAKADFNIIPIPMEITAVEGEAFIMDANTPICYPAGNAQLKRNAEFLSQYIEQITGHKLQCIEGESNNAIILSEGLDNKNPEAYKLSVSADGITIQGASAAGAFYGVQTLRKSLPISKKESIIIPATEINDAPRFAYRGAHLDVSRHFVNSDSVRRFIDILALHNINRFHWHLTDDQGWRIEIKKYPKLTTVGAYRPETVIGHNTGEYDGIPHDGYYTQDEIRSIIDYAAERHITIIPEIDLPGHMQAALAAYPHLGCTGGPYEVWKMWGVSENVLCAGNDQTIQFIKDVLTEVVELFPSEYIHVGGDECPKIRWQECPKCQARIKKENLKADGKHTAEERLQSYVINLAEKHLNSLGRQMIGWDETLEGGLAPNATVMSWRGEGGGIEAARQHHDVIMTPNTYLYFDYYQTKDKENEPEAIGGYLPVETVYNYEPIPSSLSPEEAKYIIGVQANLWTEYIPNFAQLEYMELPRMAALCEVQWSLAEKKNYNCFTGRLPHMLNIYKKLGHNYATHVYDIKADFAADTQSRSITAEFTTIDNADIYYTLDGTEPTTKSKRYNGKITINETCTLKAAAIRSDEQGNPTERGRILEESFTFNKATGCPIEMLSPISKQYEFSGAVALVDGLKAPDTNYQAGRWIGFYRGPLEAVIDLGEDTEISSVRFNTCVEKGAWIFDARSVTLSISDDKETFTEIMHTDIPSMQESQPNKIYNHQYTFSPVKTRYIKIKATSEESIPAWHGGKGRPAFLFIDEIVVE